jgi:hypothetical protein
MKAVLAETGLRIHTAACSDEALGVLEVHGEIVRLVVTDIQMPPGMDGLTFAGNRALGDLTAFTAVHPPKTDNRYIIGTDLPESARAVRSEDGGPRYPATSQGEGTGP